MADEPQKIHVVFFPFMAYGHMIPMLDIARLFAARGVEVTIITTSFNAPIFNKAVKKNMKEEATTVGIEVFRFPATECGFPEGCENMEQAMALGLVEKFVKSAEMLSEQFEQYLNRVRPTCLVADMFLPWTSECAAKHSIRRLVFHGMSAFALCSIHTIRAYHPFKNVSTDEEPFVIPYLPHEIYMTRPQIPLDLRKDEQNDYKKKWDKVEECEVKSYGVVVNSFYELEPDYADFFRGNLGRRAWHIGPVSLRNRSIEDKVGRGKQASVDEHECLKWLDSKKPNSVLYVCFGSTCDFAIPQQQEIAQALEISGHDFIWVIRNKDESGKIEDSLPPGFEERTKGRGLIIRGWAPQVLILEHEAIGAFVTHCGWNSTLEGISAGLPLVTWPLFADQFYNENLINQILKIGVPVGATKWSTMASDVDVIRCDAIVKAFREIMVGQEAENRRSRARKLEKMAWKAVEEGGSSYSDLSALIDELRG